MEQAAAGTPALLGVGVDAEQAARFEKHAAGGTMLRHVLSAREAGHLASLPAPAVALCAVFCIKEAVCKALGERYPFPRCECLYRPGFPEQELLWDPDLAARHGIVAARARVDERLLPARGECVAEVHLFGAPHGGRADPRAAAPPRVRSRLESLPIAAVREDGGPAAQLSAGEVVDLGERRVQSRAGFLALKRALAALWADAGIRAAAAPADFELAHLPGGAPRVVAAPGGLPAAGVFVSISHTRAWAYGLAVLG